MDKPAVPALHNDATGSGRIRLACNSSVSAQHRLLMETTDTSRIQRVRKPAMPAPSQVADLIEYRDGYTEPVDTSHALTAQVGHESYPWLVRLGEPKTKASSVCFKLRILKVKAEP